MYLYICVFICTNLPSRKHVFMYVQMHTFALVHTQSEVNVCNIHTFVTYIHLHTIKPTAPEINRIQTHVRSPSHTHAYTHTHVRASALQMQTLALTRAAGETSMPHPQQQQQQQRHTPDRCVSGGGQPFPRLSVPVPASVHMPVCIHLCACLYPSLCLPLLEPVPVPIFCLCMLLCLGVCDCEWQWK